MSLHDLFVEPFEPAFMQRALLAGCLAVLTSSVVGTWVVVRGLSFIGDALAHGVIPGMALAVVWGFGLAFGAAATAVVMVAGISVVSRRSRLGEDTGIGLLFVGMLALGVVIISRSDSFTSDVDGLLFGDVLGVTTGDLIGAAIAAGVVLAGVAIGYRPFVALSFNAEKAATLGLHPRIAHFALLALITVSIVASFQAVGTLLVFGLLVGPPATAALLVRRIWLMMVVAVGVGVACVVCGLLLSWHLDVAAGATMALLGVASFFVVLGAQEIGVLFRRGGSDAEDSLDGAVV
jgi:ABC-type Mn2+/Zn2+ transport system permease subunit